MMIDNSGNDENYLKALISQLCTESALQITGNIYEE